MRKKSFYGKLKKWIKWVPLEGFLFLSWVHLTLVVIFPAVLTYVHSCPSEQSISASCPGPRKQKELS